LRKNSHRGASRGYPSTVLVQINVARTGTINLVIGRVLYFVSSLALAPSGCLGSNIQIQNYSMQDTNHGDLDEACAQLRNLDISCNP